MKDGQLLQKLMIGFLCPRLFSLKSLEYVKCEHQTKRQLFKRMGKDFIGLYLQSVRFTFKFGDDEASWGESEGLKFFNHSRYLPFIYVAFPFDPVCPSSVDGSVGSLVLRSVDFSIIIS